MAVSWGQDSRHSIRHPPFRISQGWNSGVIQVAFISEIWCLFQIQVVVGNIQFLRSLSTCQMSSEGRSQLPDAIRTSVLCGPLSTGLSQHISSLPRGEQESLALPSAQTKPYNITQHVHRRDILSTLPNLICQKQVSTFTHCSRVVRYTRP